MKNYAAWPWRGFTGIFLVVIFLASDSLPGYAQKRMKQYEQTWKKIDELAGEKGQPRSAWAEVEKIYKEARLEGNEVQLIRCLLYQGRLLPQFEEDALEKILRNWEAEKARSRGVHSSLLSSLIASGYWQYLQQNRWRLYDLTARTGQQQGSLETWTIDELENKITKEFLASLQPEAALQQKRSGEFDPLLLKGKQPALRPTLYDLLAHAALDYFNHGERTMRGLKDCNTDDPNLFQPARVFAEKKAVLADTSDNCQIALYVYRELLHLHLADADPAALIDADLLRLQYLYDRSRSAKKRTDYRAALQKIRDTYPTHPAAALADYQHANNLYDEAQEYQPETGTQAGKYLLKEVQSRCRKIASAYPGSEGAAYSLNLLAELEAKELSLETEKVNLPEKPFRALVRFRNMESFHYRIIALDPEPTPDRKIWQDAFWESLTKRKYIRSGSQPLPATDDLRPHSAEIAVEGLPKGSYALLLSADKDFRISKNLLALQIFQVSDISWIHRGPDLFVLHRESGRPLGQASVRLWQKRYDAARRQWSPVEAAALRTDFDGYLRLPAPSANSQEYHLDINWEGDRLMEEDPLYLHYPRNNQKENAGEFDENRHRRYYMFSDRGIYRPGQTIWFKGIVVTRDSGSSKPRILASHNATVQLVNVQGEVLDSLEVITGDFGSFSGKFAIPATGLTGEYRLREARTGQQYAFRVEEYKRPVFQTTLEPGPEAYRLTDTVSLKGIAKNYSGFPVIEASVKYRVVRRAQFPYPWFRSFHPMSKETEISHGQARTDAEGRFLISFPALPDPTIDRKHKPRFVFTIYLEVTDQRGETQHQEASYTFGYESLLLQLEADQQGRFSMADPKSLRIRLFNYAGLPQKADVSIQVSRLHSPGRLIRTRLWSAPDTWLYTEKDFLSKFPLDEYREESRPENWTAEKPLRQDRFQASDSSEVYRLADPDLKPGWYQVEVSCTDKHGELVRQKTFIRVDDPLQGVEAAPTYLQLTRLPPKPGVSGQVEILATTAVDQLWLIQHIQEPTTTQAVPKPSGRPPKQPKPLQQQVMETYPHPYRFLQLAKGAGAPTIVRESATPGTTSISYVFVRHNRFFQQTETIVHKTPEKQPLIEVTSFRDKTLPGSAETWTLKLKGPAGERIAAEILTSMYDASLDQFQPFQWQPPNLSVLFSNDQNPFLPWNGTHSFQARASFPRNTMAREPVNYEKSYDRLLWQEAAGGMLTASMLQRSMGPELSMAVADSSPGKRSDKSGAEPAEELASPPVPSRETQNQAPNPGLRKDFRETVFFLPNLLTDDSGNVRLSFTMPEALTTWKWQILAHTKDLHFGYAFREVVTRKDLMVQPALPRFLREGDRMNLTALVSNLSDREITGQANLQLFDALSGDPVDGLFQNSFPVQYFTAPATGSTLVQFQVEVPAHFPRPLTYRIMAGSGNQNDGEENTISVLSSRMLVTETLPIYQVQGKEKTFVFDKLINAGASPSLTHHRLTVEYSSRPAWYAIQALPWLSAYPQECADQVFNRVYVNSIAALITARHPKLAGYFSKWRQDMADEKNTDLRSKLSKHPELRQVLLEETPWVMEAVSDTSRLRELAILFDPTRLTEDLKAGLEKLKQIQLPDGSFPWFSGGRADRYMTQYILSGLGRLQKMGAVPTELRANAAFVSDKALGFVQSAIRDDYERLKASKQDLTKMRVGPVQIQSLYALHYFPASGNDEGSSSARTFYLEQAMRYWNQLPLQQQAMVVMICRGAGKKQVADKIITSIREKAVRSEPLGMYWKPNSPAYYWYQASVETHALILEACMASGVPAPEIQAMKQWLILHKQTHAWHSSRATADAVHALISGKDDLFSENAGVSISLGQDPRWTVRGPSDNSVGTGYFSRVFNAEEIVPAMGAVKISADKDVKVRPAPLGFGALHWQYFEHLDQIRSSGGPLKVHKEIYIERLTDKGPLLKLLEADDEMKVGDQLKIRLVLTADRELEYVHLHDQRFAGSEPGNVLSGYKYQGGLSYYESTRDAATNFYFDVLPRGSYIFEYPLYVTHAGRFSSGPAQVQCLYAPEFRAFSEGRKVKSTGTR